MLPSRTVPFPSSALSLNLFHSLKLFSAQTEFPPLLSALVCFRPEHMNSWSLGTADLI